MQVSIGAKGNERQIKNLASGAISSTSTDAVNGSQLFSVMRVLGENAESTETLLGGNAKTNDDGSLTMSDIGGTGKNTVHDAIAQNHGDITRNTQNITKNQNSIGSINTAIATLASKAETAAANSEVRVAENLQLTSATGSDGHTIYTVGMNDKIQLEQVTTGATFDKNGTMTAGVVVDKNGLRIVKGPSVTTSGIDAGGKVIGNIAAGKVAADSSEAVNGGQLLSVQSAVTANRNSITQNQNSIGSINTAIATLASKAETAAANSEVRAAENLQLTSATGSDGHNIYTVGMNDKIQLEQVTTGATFDKNGTMTAGVVVDNTGLGIVNGPSVTTSGIDAGGKVIGNIAAGKVAADSSEAVNGGQLFSVQSAVTANRNSITQNQNSIGSINTAIATLASKAETAAANSEVRAAENLQLTSATGSDGHNIYTVGMNDKIQLEQVTTGATFDKNGTMTAGVVVDNTGLGIVNGPSVTTSGIDAGGKVIGNIAAGKVAADSSEAVNGGQLFSVQSAVTANRNSITQNQNSIGSINTAIATLASKAETAAANSEVRAAENLQLTSATGSDGHNIYTVGMNDKIQLEQVTTGATFDKNGTMTAGVVVDNTGLGIVNGPSVTTSGIDAGGKVIGNIAAGKVAADSSEAVNGGQLFSVQSAVTANRNSITQNQNSIGSINTAIATLASKAETTKMKRELEGLLSQRIGTQQSQIDAIKAAATPTASGWRLTVGEKDGQDKPQETRIGAGTKIAFKGDSNLNTTYKNGKDEIQVQFALHRDLNLDSITFGASVIDNKGLTITNGPSVTNKGIDASGKKITHVGEGEMKAGSTDAVNAGQLYETEKKIEELIARGVSQGIASGSAGIVQYADKDKPTQPNGNTPTNDVTLVGGNSEQPVTIHNVGAGSRANDAVNLSQLNAMGNRLDDRIDDLDTRARSGIASALASAALPQAYLAGESVLSAATANYRGEQALSIGASTVSPSGRWIVKGTANVNRKDASVALGIGYRF